MERFLSKLYSRINYERQIRVGPKHFKLNNLRALLKRLGNPELNFPVVHVAGTKGKGSVSTMVANALSASGRKTGLFTSPHLFRINQRIAIDGQPISVPAFENVLQRLQSDIAELDQLCEQLRHSTPADGASGTSDPDWMLDDPVSGLPLTPKLLTFFEVMTAAAFLHFSTGECDAVVLEVGLGGRLDSTNVCKPSVCVITNISLDHTRQLGSTLDKIAFEKAGIIKPGIPVVSGELKPLAADVIANAAAERDADLILLNRDFQFDEPPTSTETSTADSPNPGIDLTYTSNFRTAHCLASGSAEDNMPSGKSHIEDIQVSMLGHHQRTNASLAIAAIEVLNRLGWGISTDQIKLGLKSTTLPGRSQIAHRNPTVVLDVAHNVASMNVLIQTLNQELPAWQKAKQKWLILSISKDKDVQGILQVLLPHFDNIIATSYQENPRAVSADELYDAATKTKTPRNPAFQKITAETDPALAWQSVKKLAAPDDVVCITGSVFLIAELAEIVMNAPATAKPN